MKKARILVVIAALTFMFCCALTACDPKTEDPAPSTKYTVTFDANGGAFADGQTASIQVDSGSKISNTAIPAATREKFTIAGWYTSKAAADSKSNSDKWNFNSNTVTSDITLYAGWNEVAPTLFTVTFNANGGTFAQDATTSLKIEDGETVAQTDIPAVSRAKYDFTGWYTSKAAADNKTEESKWDAQAPITASVTLYAGWERIPAVMITVTLDANGGTFGEGVTPSIQVEQGEKITQALPVPQKTDCIFMGWYKDANGETPWSLASDVVTEAVTLYAGWFDINQSGDGSIEITDIPVYYQGTFNAVINGKTETFYVTAQRFVWIGHSVVITAERDGLSGEMVYVCTIDGTEATFVSYYQMNDIEGDTFSWTLHYNDNAILLKRID